MTSDRATQWLMTNTTPAVPFVTRMRVNGYRSLAHCDVTFGPLTVLIGLNASGKSNLLDALEFVRDCLEGRPQQAVQSRGGTEMLFHRSRGRAADRLSIEVHLLLAPSERSATDSHRVHATYGFELAQGQNRTHQPVTVTSEWLEVTPGGIEPRTGFRRDSAGSIASPGTNTSTGPVAANALWLGNAAAADETVAGVLQALTSMSFYTPDPARMAEPQRATTGESLAPDAANAGEVLGALAASRPEIKQRVDAYVAAIVPGAQGVDELPLDTYRTLHLRMLDAERNEVVRFGAGQLSYGTLRATGLLSALFQPDALNGFTSLVCVDEPELGLHPSAAGALFDALTEAAEHVQVIVATQSGDLLDRDEFDPDWVRVVAVREGATVVGPIDATGRRVLGKGLATVGELMRGDQLPLSDPADVPNPDAAESTDRTPGSEEPQP
ncbi:AAA family ATPase [Streptomyces pratensis]|uniref:AAA family ATPase n=1 Tax=Streptomyces pratensis TaxID=1169025 RepID=UPI003628E4AE